MAEEQSSSAVWMEQGESPGLGAVGVQGPPPVLRRGPGWECGDGQEMPDGAGRASRELGRLPGTRFRSGG